MNKSKYYSFLMNNLDIKIEKRKMKETLALIPLKYIVLEIGKDNKTFSLMVLFPYIKDILKNSISMKVLNILNNKNI